MDPVSPWLPTRAAALERLAAFAPRAGGDYAAGRNYDLGPGNRANVSGLSPWIRRRLLTEEEVIRAVLRHHSASAAEKFIQEVCWRSYWKGWLELRPAALERFDAERRRLAARRAADARLRADLERAESGDTGIECFDHWARELVGTGWLHNHARMWFASIWIFTLKLPWPLGADFFFKHLLDADAASNTLSWRWVAGLQTPGKHYLARADNVRRYTAGRFDPAGQLDEAAGPLPPDDPPPAARALPDAPDPAAGPVLLLLTDEDLHAESWPLAATPRAIAALPAATAGAPEAPAARFARRAVDDGLARAAAHFGVASAGVVPSGDVAALARRHGLDRVVTAHAPVGLTASSLARLQRALAAENIRLETLRRRWDALAWPHARAGFFRFKACIPSLLQSFCRG